MESTNQPPTPPAGNPNPPPDFVGAGFKTAGFRAQVPDPGPTMPASLPPSPSVAVFSSQPPTNPKRGSNKSILVIGILGLLLAGLVLGFGKIRSFVSNAQGSCEPESLMEANLTTNSVEIVFQTGKACQMEVAYGTSREALLLQVPEAMASLNHRLRLSPLLAGTTYYYQVVNSGKKLGTARSFLTKAPVPTVEPTPLPLPTAPVPSIGETTPATSSGLTFADFEAQFGSSSATFDIDKNGVVNMADWLLYQKQP